MKWILFIFFTLSIASPHLRANDLDAQLQGIVDSLAVINVEATVKWMNNAIETMTCYEQQLANMRIQLAFQEKLAESADNNLAPNEWTLYRESLKLHSHRCGHFLFFRVIDT